ncbi:hypothetical protein PIB30_098251, partial [Stylosanthes scabra]|nr:hypothetical protein [Stylosanthes scabra]
RRDRIQSAAGVQPSSTFGVVGSGAAALKQGTTRRTGVSGKEEVESWTALMSEELSCERALLATAGA